LVCTKLNVRKLTAHEASRNQNQYLNNMLLASNEKWAELFGNFLDKGE
jgi:hypothetical protein